MQDRYTGDIGDFSKLGILRALEKAGMSVGLNWYLTPDENHNSDGRHVQYLNQDRFKACDEALASIQGLDYIIFKTMDSYVPSLYIQKLSKPLLAELLKKCYGPNDKYVQYQYKRESHYWG